MKQQSQELTAFVTPWDLYEWIKAPFGLMNAPAHFQRFMENCLRQLQDEICIPHLDNVIGFFQSFEKHIKHLQIVLWCLKSHGVELKLKMCKLCKPEVPFPGIIT